jgi:hypothetical protein
LADQTGYCVLGQLHGKLFILAIDGLDGGYDDDTLQRLAHIARINNVNKVIIEANFGDGMYTKLFSPILHKIYPCSIEEVKHSIQKEKRIIDTLEPVMNQHRLVISLDEVKKDLDYIFANPERNQKYSFTNQLTRLTRDRGSLRHDDRLDALAIAVAYFVESMDRDEEDAHKAHRTRLLHAEIDKHLANCLGAKRSPVRDGFLGSITYRNKR